MSRNELRAAGILLLLLPLTIVVSWTGLMIRFEYPDILRQPVEDILLAYRDGGWQLKLYWSGMAASSLLIVPVVMMFYRLTGQANRSLRLVSAGIGLSSAIFHVLGFSRWLFAVDFLAAQYSESPAQKETIEIIVQTLQMYLGVTVGETLGFATMGIWAVLTAIALRQSGWMPKWAAGLSIVSGLGIAAGILEWTGWPAAVEMNAYAYQMWLLILMCLAVSLLWKSRKGNHAV